MPNPTLYDNFNQVRQYIDQNQVDLSSYVSKSELEGMSYATTSDLSNYLLSPTISGYEGQMKLYNDGFFEVTSSGAIRAKSFTYNQLNSWSAYTLINRNSLRNYVDGRLADIESSYATQTYVADYVAEHGGGGGSTVIDENIIPKETGTYTLGDASYLYSATYATSFYTIEKCRVYSTTNNNLWFMINNGGRFYMDNNGFYGNADGARNLGSSSNNFGSTYTNNLYSPSLVLSYSYNSIDNASNTQINFKVNQWNRMKLTNTALMPSTNNGIKLGDPGAQWSSTYVRDLYLNGTNIINKINGMFSYDSTTGTLTITTLS